MKLPEATRLRPCHRRPPLRNLGFRKREPASRSRSDDGKKRVLTLLGRRISRRADTDADAEGDGDDDEDHDAEADPLVPAGADGVLDAGVDLGRALGHVDVGLLGPLLDLRRDGVLLHHHRVEILEQADQLGDRLLDALELVLSRPHVAEDGGCLAGAVGEELDVGVGWLVTGS